MKLHTSCTTLLLSDYIICQVDKDLSPLIIEGEPTEQELKDAWQVITHEFFDLSESKQNNYELTLCAEMEALNYKIIAIQQSVEVLRKYRCDELVALLQKLGYRFPFNANKEDEYLKDLGRVLSRAKTLVLQYNDKKAQLDNISKEKAPGETEVSRSYYDKILAILSKHSGYHVDESKTTVSRYAAILNMYIAYCEQLNAQK